MVYRIPEAKPSLKSGGSPVDVSEAKPALAYDPNSDIIMFSEESWFSIVGGWLKTSALFLLSALLIFAVMYCTLAASLLFTTSVDGKVSVVARNTFLGGIPSKGDVILISQTQKAGDNPLDHLKEAVLGVDQSQVVKVLSGPNDAIQVNGDSFSVAGQEPGNYTGPILDANGQRVASTVQLGKQYLVECVTGNCKPGEFTIVNDVNIFGEMVDLGATK